MVTECDTMECVTNSSWGWREAREFVILSKQDGQWRFDMKIVVVTASGKVWRILPGGFWGKASGMFAGTVSCDSIALCNIAMPTSWGRIVIDEIRGVDDTLE